VSGRGSIHLGVVNVLLGPIAPQPVSCNLKLLGAVSKGHEAQNPEEDADGLSRHHLDRAHIDSLRVVAQPVAKVDALYVHFAELLASPAGNEERKQCVFNVSMAPVLALDCTQAGNVTCTKSCGGAGPENKKDQAWQPDRAELEFERHRGCLYVLAGVGEDVESASVYTR
jgi:hypothetical protein